MPSKIDKPEVIIPALDMWPAKLAKTLPADSAQSTVSRLLYSTIGAQPFLHH